MYRPAHFDVAEIAQIHDIIDSAVLAHLVVAAGESLESTPLPMLLDRDAGPFGTLTGHLARPNPLSKQAVGGQQALAIFAGPDAYISPSYYGSKQEDGKVVPTWNYTVVHAHGELIVHDDPVWVEALVRRLTERHEGARPVPWSVDDAPADYIKGLMKRIVGIELRITRLEGKRKLSQNKPEDLDGIIVALEAGTPGETAVARSMR